MFWFKRNKNRHRAFVSLGGGANQLPLIKAALNLGFKVVCVDKDTSAPGMIVSNIKIQESILSCEDIFTKLNELFLDTRISGILSRSYGDAIRSVSYLCEKYSIKHIPFARMQELGEKKKMKAAFAKMEIPSPQYASFSAAKKIPFPFPFVLKPSSGHAKTGVKLIISENDLKAYVKALPADSGDIIAEKYIEGDEVVVLGLVSKKRFSISEITDKIKTPAPYFVDIMHVAPSKYQHRWDEIEKIGQKLADYYEMENTPLVMEIIFTDNEELFLIEAAPEFGGEFLAEHLLPARIQGSIFEDAINSQTSNLFCKSDSRKSRTAVAVKYAVGKNGIIDSCVSSEKLADENVIFHRMLKTVGDESRAPKNNHDRLAVVIAKGRSREEAIKNAEHGEELLEIKIKQKSK